MGGAVSGLCCSCIIVSTLPHAHTKARAGTTPALSVCLHVGLSLHVKMSLHVGLSLHVKMSLHVSYRCRRGVPATTMALRRDSRRRRRS
eukprot:363904-Chlamydomonas_euryale.AAC.6